MTQATQAATEEVRKAPQPRTRQIALPAVAPADNETIKWIVRDLLATNGPRTHMLTDSHGRNHNFTFASASAEVEIPMVMASKLVGNDGFEVRNQRGEVMRIINSLDDVRNNLAPDECVAKFDELTQDALIARANVIRTEHGILPLFSKKDAKDDIISFLLEVSFGSNQGDESFGDDDFEEEESVG